MNIIREIKSQPIPTSLLLLLLASLPFERIPSYDIFGVTIRISTIVGLLLLLISAPIALKRSGDWIKQPWIWLSAYIIVAILSTITSLNPTKGIKVLLFTAFVFLLSWVVSIHVRKIAPEKLIYVILLSTAASLLFGIYQFFGDLIGLSPYLTGLREAYTKSVFGFPRIQSFSLEPLYYANFLLIPGSISAFFFMRSRKLFGLALFSILVIVWLTLSRGGYYAFAVIIVAALIYGLVIKKYARVLQTIILIGLSIFASLSLIFIGSNFNVGPSKTDSSTSLKRFQQQSTNTDQGESVEGRAFSRNLAIDLFEQNPVKGVGPGNYGVHANNMYPERYPNDSGIVNNETLEIMAETGLVGFLAILGFALSLLLRMFGLIKKVGIMNLSGSSLLAMSLFIALIATAVQYQAFSTLYITHIWVAVGLFVGLSGKTIVSDKKATRLEI